MRAETPDLKENSKTPIDQVVSQEAMPVSMVVNVSRFEDFELNFIVNELNSIHTQFFLVDVHKPSDQDVSYVNSVTKNPTSLNITHKSQGDRRPRDSIRCE